jgi:hypothetical protein
MTSQQTSDPFDIDYVARKMGHQFGMISLHVIFKHNDETDRQKAMATRYGICGHFALTCNKIQMIIFHHADVRDITANALKPAFSGALLINLNIAAPQVNAGANYTIPFSTFVLDGTATNVIAEQHMYGNSLIRLIPRGSAGSVLPGN